MEANLEIINTFATRVRQLILHDRELRKENGDLYAMVDERDKQIEDLKAQVEKLRHDYDSLKMAKMLQVTDGDLDTAKKRVNKLIRDVNKCITLLSGK